MIIEPIDDLPLLGMIIKDLELPSLYNQHFTDHAHWNGISGGHLLFGWLLYVLSEADHRLSHVEEWADLRLNTLAAIMESPELRRLDFSDDRLGRILDKLADDKKWESFERAVGSLIVQVYQHKGSSDGDTSPHVVRTDTFNVPQFRAPEELFRIGYSKQRRGDLPFCKVMVGYLDKLSMPLGVDVVKGSGPDNEHYLPMINKISDMLEVSGNLYVGDSALGTTSNRTAIQAAGNYYLCPLNHKQVTEKQLGLYLNQLPPGPVENLPGLFTDEEGGRGPAYFYELTEQICDAQTDLKWEERRILVYSPRYVTSLRQSFQNRLDEAEEKMMSLTVGKRGRRNPNTLAELQARIIKIEEEYGVVGCFNVQCHETKIPVHINKHKDRPARTEDKVSLSLVLVRNTSYIEQKSKSLSWQVYGSNAPKEIFSTAQLVNLYRDEYSIEHFFNYFINRDVGLLPVYLKKVSRVKSLVRLLSLAMKCSMIVQFKIRAALFQKQETLGGIYPGNKGRKTAKPTTPMILRAFRGIAAVCISPHDSPEFKRTTLGENQKIILDLLEVPLLYDQITALLKPISLLRET